MDASALLQQMGRKVRLLRERQGWSQEELARRCGRHFTYIGRVERGEQNITVEVLLDIALALGIGPDELLRQDDHELLRRWSVRAIDVVEAVGAGFRAQVDVKGKLAELMLYRELSSLKNSGEIKTIQWMDADGQPDFILEWNRRRIVVECKNVRSPAQNRRSPEPIRAELQKTRNAKDGTNTRGYKADHFDLLSVCLFNRTGKWEFLHVATRFLVRRDKEPDYLKIMQDVPAEADATWKSSILEALECLKNG